MIVRVSQTASKLEVDRVLAAIARSGFDVPLSINPRIDFKVDYENVVMETGKEFEERIVKNPSLGLRIWQLGEKEGWQRAALPKPDIHIIQGEVLVSGRLTGLNLVREQAVSITQHRFGALQAPLL